MLRPISRLLLAFLVALPLVLVATLPASANTGDRGTRMELLQSCTTALRDGTAPAEGRWSSRIGVHFGTNLDLSSQVRLARDIRMFLWRLEEPCYNPAQTGTSRVGFSWDTAVMPNDLGTVQTSATTSATRLTAQGKFGVANPTVPPALPNQPGSQDGYNNYIVCADTEYSTPENQRTSRLQSNGASMRVPSRDFTGYGGGGVVYPAFEAGSVCGPSHYIVRIVVTVCDVLWNNRFTGAVNYGNCDSRVWTGDPGQQASYGSDLPPEEVLCDPLFNSQVATNPDCVPYYDPPTDQLPPLENWCDGAPVTDILNWSWLGPWVVHYVRCLTDPRAGFDSEGLLAASLDRNGMSGVTDSMTEIYDAFALSGSCGYIIPPIDGVLDGFAVSTCGWTWAAPVKSLLGAGLWILGGFVLVSFFMNTLLSPVTKNLPKVTPS